MWQESVTTAEHGGLFRIRLTGSAPSLTDATVKALQAALDAAEASPSARVVVLQGGSEAFCTGLDFSESVGGAAADDSAASFFGLMRRLTQTPRVVVSVVDGRATGGGVGLAAAGDLVLATGRAEFVLPEVLWGLLPCCVLPFVIRRTGFQAAYAMALSTLPVGVERAYGHGLVDEVCEEPGSVLRRLAARISRVDPRTVAELKEYADVLSPITPAVEREAVQRLAKLMSDPDVQRNLEDFATYGRYPWQR